MNKWGDSAKSQCSTKRNDRTCFVEWHPYFKRNVLTLNLQSVCKKKKKKVCEVFMESFNNRKLCKYLLFIMCVTKEEVVELTNKKIEYPVLFFFILFSFVLIIFSLFSLFLSICLCCNLDGYILAVIETSTWGHREGEVLWDLDQFGARN